MAGVLLDMCIHCIVHYQTVRGEGDSESGREREREERKSGREREERWIDVLLHSKSIVLA